MRNLWLSLALLAAVVFSPHPSFAAPTTAIGMPQQCVNNATNPTSAEWLTCTQARAGTSALNPIYVSGGGGGGGSANTQWYTGAAWANWKGQTAGVDNLSNSTPAPFTYNLPMYYNANLGKWDRDQGYARLQLYGGAPGSWVNISQGVSGDSYNTSTTSMLPTINLPMYYTGTGTAWNRARGAAAGADNVVNTTIHGTNEFAYSMVYNASSGKWDRMTQPGGGTTGASSDTTSGTQSGIYDVSLNHFYNSTSTKFQRWTGPGAGADAISNSTPSPWTSGFLYGSNGTTWDRLRAGAGAKGAGVLRVTLASDDAEVADIGTIKTNTGTVSTNSGTISTNTGNSATALQIIDDAFVADAGTVGSKSILLGGLNTGKQYSLLTGEGQLGTGVLRVNLATDDDLVSHANNIKSAVEVIDDAYVADGGTAVKSVLLGGLNSSKQYSLLTGEGQLGTGVLRVNLATDDDAVTSLGILDDALVADAGTVGGKSVLLGGANGGKQYNLVTGEGTISTGVLRVNLATDDDGVTSLGTLDDVVGTSGAGSPTKGNMVGFSDGTNFQLLNGSNAGADAVTNSTKMPWMANFNYGYNGTTWDRLYVLGTQADAQATTVNGLVTSSFLYGYNGSTFDMLRIGASNELQVTDVAVRPGEDAGNDYRKVKIDAITTNTPAKKTTAVDSTGTDIVIASTQVIGYTNFCAYVKNVGGGSGAAFNNLQFQTSPDDTSWTGDLGWTDGDAAASGSTFVYCVSGNGYNYVRAVASTAASDTTADGWITLNKG